MPKKGMTRLPLPRETGTKFGVTAAKIQSISKKAVIIILKAEKTLTKSPSIKAPEKVSPCMPKQAMIPLP